MFSVKNAAAFEERKAGKKYLNLNQHFITNFSPKFDTKHLKKTDAHIKY